MPVVDGVDGSNGIELTYIKAYHSVFLDEPNQQVIGMSPHDKVACNTDE